MEPTNGNEIVSPTSSKPIATHESGNHSPSFINIMKKTVLHHKIPYWNENETEGDGNCFYNAIIDQIQNNPGVYDTLSDDAKQCSTPSELRAAVITFIASWPQVLSQQETLTIWRESGLGEGVVDWETYLHEQGKNGVNADDMVIHCTATFLGKDIFVTTEQNKEIWRHVNSHSGTRGTPITLASNQSNERDEHGNLKYGGEHFQSLVPTEKEGNACETCRNCAQQNIKRLKSHLNNSRKECSRMYDLDLLAAGAKAKAQQKTKERNARYYKSNRESLTKKKAEYDKQHREEKQKSQAEYDKQHREKKQKSQAVYDSQHRPEKAKSQAVYDSQHRPEKAKSQAVYDSQHRAEKRKSQASYYSKHRPEKKAAVTANRNLLKKNLDIAGRLKDFRTSQRDGLSYPCASCCRLWFKSSVVDVTDPRSKMNLETLEPLKINENDKLPSTYLCGTCQKYLKANKLPPLAAKNGLSIESMPDDINLSELEAVLCSRNIIFAKIHRLPRNWCLGSKEKVVNVPINSDDLRNTLDKITTFPRQPIEGGLLPISEGGISVKLKRKQSYKGHHLHKTINPEKVVKAIEYFKAIGNPLYQEIDINRNYSPKFPSDQDIESENNCDNETNCDTNTSCYNETNCDTNISCDNETNCDNNFINGFDENCSLQEARESDEDDDRLEAVKNNQFGQMEHYVMADDHPEQRCLTSSSKSIKDLHLAPGEGKIPSSLMRDDSWDVGGFPHLNPSGNFGLHHEREVKISHQKYFLQRLQNLNPQFRNSKPYIFAATYFMERHQFEQRINLTCQRGTIENGDFSESKDPMNVFDQVKGTPKFWQKKRREMVAKIAQLGPFQFFFTLSCADKRWAENFVSILTQLGHTVSFEKSGTTDHMYDDPCVVMIDGEPMEDFLSKNYPDLHKLVRENIFTITKVFDKRVQNFIKKIVFGKNGPMKAQHYQYRIEFQSRGAGHVHGVLWLNLKELDASFPGIKDIFRNIKKNEPFDDEQMVTIRRFIDTFISCSLQDETVSHIVKEVQIHNHSKTCRKYGSKCRFGFPKFPSEFTIVAQPLLVNDFSSKEDLEKHQKMLKTVLEKVRNILEAMDIRKKDDKLFAQHLLEKITIDDILIHAEIAEDLKTARQLYYEALSVSIKGKIIILKRKVQEMWVNNYNPEWLLAWNGNMDIQLCLDFFAICTYITDYYTKDETGTMTHLIKAVKECHGKGQKETMRALANEFSSHRQVGESEAYYKLFPELHLTQSSVKTVFVAGGFPEDRNVFLRKVKPKEKAESEEEEEDEG